MEEQNRLKKEKEKERQRKRRMDPEFRAKERARNRILKRISRQKNFYAREVLYFMYVSYRYCKIFQLLCSTYFDIVSLPTKLELCLIRMAQFYECSN